MVLLASSFFFNVIVPQTPTRVARVSFTLSDDLPLWSFLTSLPIPVPSASWLVATVLVAVTIVTFAAYGLAVVLAWGRRSRSSKALVMGVAGLTFLFSALALPNFNSDVYDYVLFGRVSAVHGENPYETFPDAFPDDPMYPYSTHQFTGMRDNKLPAWTLLTTALAHVGNDDPVDNLLLYRFALLAVNAANVALVALILQRIRPSAALAGVLLYAWNPIVALQGQSKTDTVMAFFVLLATLLLSMRHRTVAGAALVLSVFVKLITVPLLALFWVAELRRGRFRQIALDALVVVGVLAGLYLPFSNDLGLLSEHLRMVSDGGSEATGLLRVALLIAFVGLIAVLGLRRRNEGRSLLCSWALVALFFAALLSRLGLAWYLIVPLAVVAVAGRWRLALAAVTVSFSSFLFNGWYALSTEEHPLPEVSDVPPLLVYLIPMALFGVAVLLLARLRRRGDVHGSATSAASAHPPG